MNWMMSFLASFICGAAGAALVAVIGLTAKRMLPKPARAASRPRMVVVDSTGPIIGKPTRAQWRLRRRALLEAAEICDQYAGERPNERSHDAEACGWRIRGLVREYDLLSPEYSGEARRELASERVA